MTYKKLIFIIPLILSSCVKEEINYDNSNRGNLEALWNILDQRYCFFDYKQQQIGLDWDDVHRKYLNLVNEDMKPNQLFEILCNMVAEMQDGHVNLFAAYDLGRNWSFYEKYDKNYDEEVIERYLGKGNDYMIASSIKYRILEDNVAYLRCPTFDVKFGDGNLSAMFDFIKGCNGIILDVRGNGGGSLDAANKLAARFVNKKTLTGYVYHKTGKGHDDFSKPEPTHVEPADAIRWQKKVIILTNRETFSAANDFVKSMKVLDNVTVVGDTTGGGSGMPFNMELPNGWGARYSAVVFLDANKQHTEFGIPPDINVSLKQEDAANGYDSIIEYARALLAKQ